MSHGSRFARLAAAWCLCFSSVSAQAYALNFLPAVQSVGLGSEATVEVRVSGVLPDGLGAYLFDVTFDPGIVAFDRAVDGSGLGLAFGLGVTPTPGAGRVTVSDFSLEAIDDLLALQTDEFLLFSLVFDTLAAGTSSLGFDLVTLGNAAGDLVQATALGDGSITVEPGVIPEPTSIALVLVALLASVRPFTRRRG